MKQIVKIFPGLVFLFMSTAILSCSQSKPSNPSNPEITSAEIRDHVFYLASDEMRGRDSGSEENDRAAEYIAAEFKYYGLKPAGENGTYFQTFEVITGMDLGEKNRLMFQKKNGENITANLNENYMPFSFSDNGSATGGIVFVGFGISAQNLQYDDYQNIDATDKILIAFYGSPDGDNPHGDFGSFSEVRSKVTIARQKGAKALILIPMNPDDSNLPPVTHQRESKSAGLITAHIQKGVAEQLFAGTDNNLQSLYDNLSSTKKPSSFVLDNLTCEIDVELNKIRKSTRNVIGALEGTDPQLKSEYIVVGAHHDHIGMGYHSSRSSSSKPEIHNGADDNASGTTGILELAEKIAAEKDKLKRSVLFMTFSGEEMGLLGSQYFVNNPTVPLEKIPAMVNLDMIGRFDDDKTLSIFGVGSSSMWEEFVKKHNEKYQFQLSLVKDPQGSSDHSSFYRKEIPVLFFNTGLHSEYHRPEDDPEKINTEGEAQLLKFVYDVIVDLNTLSEHPDYIKVIAEQKRGGRFKVYIGTLPDYGHEGEGMRITGTQDGSPAQKAGMQEGDIITEFGDIEVKSIYDYMHAISTYNPGDKVEIIVQRGEEKVTLDMRLVKR